MAKRKTFVTATSACAVVSVLILACSSNNTTPSSALRTEVTDAGFAGCAALEQGCYTVSGTYPLPATSATCASPGGPATGAADDHCSGVPAQTVDSASCSVSDAGSGGDDGGGGTASDAGPAPAPGACGENSGDYGTTMYGSSGHDDDCKYAVSYTTSPICENDGTYFIVNASYLSRNGAPLTGACTYAELCLNDTHLTPPADSRPPSGSQLVVEGPPGTYTIGPVVFDQAGDWTVRFHFNEICCDVVDDSPHGHAAFHVSVP